MRCDNNDLPQGFFVTIEGIDGSGKSTVVKELEKLSFPMTRYTNGEAFAVRQPGSSLFAEAHRHDCLNENVSVVTQQFYYMALINDSMEKTVVPSLENGAVVISDRWFGSTMAYQGLSQHRQHNVASAVRSLESRHPELSIYLGLPLEVALERTRKEDGDRSDDRFAGAALLEKEKIKEAYDLMFDVKPMTNHLNIKRTLASRMDLSSCIGNQYEVVDATQPVDKIVEDCYKLILKSLHMKTCTIVN